MSSVVSQQRSGIDGYLRMNKIQLEIKIIVGLYCFSGINRSMSISEPQFLTCLAVESPMAGKSHTLYIPLQRAVFVHRAIAGS